MTANPEKTHYHTGTPVLTQGSDLKNAKSALILLHGRGASAQDIIGLASELSLPADMIALAPQAKGSIWYPQPLTASLESNEPYLSAAIQRINEVVDTLTQAGIPHERIVIGGFSQGASLSSEFVLRSSRRWGGLLIFSGGYIWPAGQPRPSTTGLDGTPVFIACSNVDPFIPLARVEDTAALLSAAGASVTKQIYPGMGHTIVADEIARAQPIISALG